MTEPTEGLVPEDETLGGAGPRPLGDPDDRGGDFADEHDTTWVGEEQSPEPESPEGHSGMDNPDHG